MSDPHPHIGKLKAAVRAVRRSAAAGYADDLMRGLNLLPDEQRELDQLIDQLSSIERLLPDNAPPRRHLAATLGLLLAARSTDSAARPDDRAEALRRLRRVDRQGPDDGLTTSARLVLLQLLVPNRVLHEHAASDDGVLCEALAFGRRGRLTPHAPAPELVEACGILDRLSAVQLPAVERQRLDRTQRRLELVGRIISSETNPDDRRHTAGRVTEEKRRNDVDVGDAAVALRAWAAVAVRQANELWRRSRNEPPATALRFVIEHLTTVERMLPTDHPARVSVVPWLGILLHVRLRRRPDADSDERETALRHLRWVDRARPLNDQLAMRARSQLGELLAPEEIPQDLRDGAAPADQVESLRRDLTEAVEVFGRIVAGDTKMRETGLGLMERVAAMLSCLPGPSEGGLPSLPQRPGSEEAEPPEEAPEARPVAAVTGGSSSANLAEEALADAVQALVALASRDAFAFTRLLVWLCVTVNGRRVSAEQADEELAALDLTEPIFAPLRELLAQLRTGGEEPRLLAARVGNGVRLAREAMLALPADAPERMRMAKFHAALMAQGNFLVPEMTDAAEVDPVALGTDPDPNARSAWRGELSLETILFSSIDNQWVSNGDVGRLERSAAWIREQLDALPEHGEGVTATRRHLASLLAQRVATAGWIGGSRQDITAAAVMVKELGTAGDPDGFLSVFSAHLEVTRARRGLDPAGLSRLTETLIEKLSHLYSSLPPNDGVRLMVAAQLGWAHKERATRTGAQAELHIAAGYFREVVETDPARVPPLIAFPVVRASLMIELAEITSSREAMRRAITEVHRVAEAKRASPYMEAGLRFALGRALLRATKHREDLSLLDLCISELNRVRALVAAGHGLPSNSEPLTVLSDAYWTSAITGGPRASEDRKASMNARREALEEMAAEVLLQFGADHGLSVARGASRHALWLALRCAENRRPAEAVEALELGRGLVLHTAATSHSVPELLATNGYPDLAERWKAEAPEDPHRPGGAALVPLRTVGQFPSSLRRQALAALSAGSGTGARDLLGTPDVAELTAGLAASGADALVYLLPGKGFSPHIPGRAVVLRPGAAAPTVLPLPLLLSPGSHSLERYLNAASARFQTATDAASPDSSQAASEADWQAALDDLCDWAWPAAIQPVLAALERLGRPPRIVLIPCGPLGVVPWHAARKTVPLGGYRYACQDAVFSYAPSGAQFLRAMARDRLPTTGHRVLVADPGLTLVWSEIETEALRASVYPDALHYGEFPRTDGAPDASATCDDLLDVLPGGGRPAALVHVSCHGLAGASPTRSALSLADGELTVARILDRAAGETSSSAGPLVVLSACETDFSTRHHDEALTLSTALVARGAADVIGSRWAVNDGTTAVMMTVFHDFLTGQRLAPADALRAAQLWMLDPNRQPPPTLRDPLLREATRTDLHQIHHWAAFTHQGNPAATTERSSG
ncbi:CHAT domain-containing protein [Streptomyces sp. B6B3]|uniref:CHAT domain-containing protein n=1 Tax=Streptomyces sp. B6B3 TaxID=3153570 RepID=UPI00325C8935